MLLGIFIGGLAFAASELFPPPAFAQDLRIADFSYDQHFRPGETITFTVRIRNNESTDQDAFSVIILTNSKEGLEVEVDSATETIAAGQTRAFTSTTTLTTKGIYTVSLRAHSGANVRRDRVQGKFPIHIGTETETIQVFPEVIHFGSLPPGRYMHPMPIEVSWDFYRFNRLRLDHPFVIRVYTDNAARYQGIRGALRRASPGGLVSLDGRYAIPLKIWCLNFGPDLQETGWDSALAGPPPVQDDNAWLGPPLLEGGRHLGGVSWVRVKDRSELAASPFGWTRGEGLIGQDPHSTVYANEKNPTGDITLTSPFTFYIATEAGPTAVEGSYAGTLIVELWNP